MNTRAQIGHNSNNLSIRVSVKLFNAMHSHGDPKAVQHPLTYPVGTTVETIFKDLNLPREHLFLILVNGRDISAGRVGDLYFDHELEDGDVVAFSGPVPYSFGYGAPVV